MGRHFLEKNLPPLNPLKISPYLTNVKKNLKKRCEKVWQKEKSAYLCNRKRETTLPPEGGTDGIEKEFFEEIYDIQQEKVRTQGKRPSIHNRMKEAWDREKNKTFYTTESLILAQDER